MNDSRRRPGSNLRSRHSNQEPKRTHKSKCSQEWPRQTKPKKGQFMNFSQGHSGTKVQCESCLSWWTFRIFLIFSRRGGGKEESGATGRGRELFFIENPRRVGRVLPSGRGGEGAGSVFARNLGGRGAKYFFPGPKLPPSCFLLKDKHQNSQKWAKFMNFSFWPFLWFGFAGATPDNRTNSTKDFSE